MVEDDRAQVKRRFGKAVAWVIVALFALAEFAIFISMRMWNQHVLDIGLLAVLVTGGLVWAVLMIVSLHQASASLEATEWMKRGGLMEAPEASAQPDEIRIRLALRTLPADVEPAARAEIEAYLAMPHDDEKQLRRDRLIRRFYERASSSHEDLAHRRAYNQIRLALSPWAQADSEE